MSLKPVRGKIESQELNNNFSYLDSTIRNIDKGSPKGVFDTVQQLKDAHPNGDSGIYIVGDSWYFWDGSDWEKGGVYQAQGLADLSVERRKLADEAVSPGKTNFFTKEENLFDGIFLEGFAYLTAGSFGNIGASSSENRFVAVIEIEPNETYTVTKFKGGNRFNLVLINEYPQVGQFSYGVYNFIGEQSDKVQTHTFTNTQEAKYVAIHTNSGVSDLPNLSITMGNEIVPFTDSFKLSESLYDNPYVYSDNLYNGVPVEGIAYYSLGDYGNISGSSEPNRYSAVIPIEEDQTYSITKFEGGNRFNVLLLLEYPVGNKTIYALKRFIGDQSSTKQSHVIENDVGAKYLVIHTNSGVANVPNVSVVKGIEIKDTYKPNRYIPTNDLFPLLETSENLFDGEFSPNFAYWTAGYIQYTSGKNRFTAFIPIEKNKEYTITKFEGGNRFNVALIENLPTKNVVAEVLYSHIGAQRSLLQSHVFVNNVDANYLAVHTNSGATDKPNLMVTEGNKVHEDYVPQKYIPNYLLRGDVNRNQRNNGRVKYSFVEDLNGIYTDKDVYTFDNAQSVKSQEIYDLYDNLVTNYPEYVKRTNLGTVDGQWNIYGYTFSPIKLDSHLGNDNPKIIITTGAHGDEKGPVYSTYNLFDKICNDWRGNEILEFLRFNIEFVVVPVVNPSGFDENTRRNYNNVDLNRNFPAEWSDEPTYSGPEAASEEETQILMDLLENNLDAEYLIDYHNMYFRDGYFGYTWTSDKFINDIVLSNIKVLGRKWQKEYEFFPQDENHKFGYSTEYIPGSLAFQAKSLGITDNLLEIVREVKWQEGSTMYDELTIVCGLELLANTLKATIKESLM